MPRMRGQLTRQAIVRLTVDRDAGSDRQKRHGDGESSEPDVVIIKTGSRVTTGCRSNSAASPIRRQVEAERTEGCESEHDPIGAFDANNFHIQPTDLWNVEKSQL